MRLGWRVAMLALALAPVAALGDNHPQVVMATPGVGGGAIERFTVRFSQPMVALGDPRAADPFTEACAVAGQGCWIDPQTFVYEFGSPLPGGASCTFKLRDGLKSAGGDLVTGQTRFTVDAGGPRARAVLPEGRGDAIEEDQVFLVAANQAPDRASVAANAYCAVDGVGEKIAVEVLGEALPGTLLSAMGTDRWEVRSFLDSAGLPAAIPTNAAARAKALAGVVALRCRRPLPAGREMALVWGAGVTGIGGKRAGADQRFDYTVRKAFAARFECTRVNVASGCNPVEKATITFTAPVSLATAQAVRIKLPDGRRIAPTFSKDDLKKATVDSVPFAAPLPFATDASVELPADIKDESGRALTNAARFPLAVRFDQAPPLVKFAGNFGVIEAAQGGVLPVTVRNVEPALQGRNLAVSGQAMRVGGADGDVAAWLRKLTAADKNDFRDEKRGREKVSVNHTRDTPVLRGATGTALSVALPGKGRDFEVVGIPLSKPGFYVVELASPVLGRALLGRDRARYVATGALVTNMSVHFEWGRERSLAWVTSLDTGKPVANAEVRVSDSCTGRLLAHGATDRTGGVFIPKGLPQPETYGGCTGDDDEGSGAHPLMVSARAGEDMSFTLTAWGEGIQPTDFELPYGYEARGQVMHTVFDRALVRQGETLHMKHLLRQPDGGGFTIPAGFSGTLRLSHRGSDTQFDVPLSIAAGSGETSWTAPAGAPMGDYDLSVITADKRQVESGQSFRVDEYKLPTMRATATGPKAAAVRPRSLPLDLFVGYLSGGGAGNLPVTLRAGWFAHAATPDGYDRYTFGGQRIEEGLRRQSQADEGGEETLPPTQTIPVTLGRDGTLRTAMDTPTLAGTADMKVEMDYQDANGQVLTATRTVPIWASAVQLGIATDGWMMKQDDLRLRFVALDLDGKPIAGKKVAVALYSRQTLTARRRLIGGFYAYDNQEKTTRLDAACSATTDAQGLAQCKVDPGVSGEVFAVATATDDAGNTVRAVKSVWLAGADEWWFGGDNGDRMDVVPEAPSYKAGETARFQVRMPFRHATALVSVEREGVLSSFVTELSGTDPVVEVPMPGWYAPDVYVSVMAVRGRVEPGWRDWLHRVAVALHLSSGPDLAPDATALVDLAKPSFRLGIARVKVGWEAHRLDVDVEADHERYAARGTASVDVAVRRPDGTPARAADVTFAAVDEALLQLAPNQSWDVLAAMMGDRPLSVLTSTAQTQVVGKRHYGRKAVEAGGGGGGGDTSALNRENFQPVLLWRGRVPLDAKGHARVTVPLSDALSSFKLVAIASDGAQRFGTGSTSVRTAQDLSIYAGLPPLVRSGDWYSAGFTLRNGSDHAMTVTANVDLFPRIARGRALTVQIPAGGAVPIAWNVTAPENIPSLRWQVSARASDGRAADKVTVTQDVVPAVPVETWAATLARVGEGAIPVAPPMGALPGRGSVDIRLDDTLAPPLQGVREYMSLYPYNCFEQQLSRLIVMGDAGAWTRLAGAIPTYQAPDGLLRYFPSDQIKGSETLTAYVLSITAEAGLPIPEASRAKMIAGMRAVLDGRLRNEDYGDVRLRRVEALAALARQGAATPAMLGQIGVIPADMPTSLLVDYLAALDHIPAANAAALRAVAEAQLRARLVYEGTRLDLTDSSQQAWWLMSSGDEASIKALRTVLGRPGWQGEGPRMMVGVALRQVHGHWDTTTANAWGALAARRFARLYPAQAITGTTSIALGARLVSRGWPLAASARTLSLPLPVGPTPLVLRQSGGAGPWASVSVHAAVPLRQPLSAGYRMTRAVTVVQRRVAGRLTRGDVVRVTLTVDATADRNWVVVSDPVPAGATILGDLGGQSQLLQAGQQNGGGRFGAVDPDGKPVLIEYGAQPAYVERARDAYRGYFEWVPRGRFAVSYTMRLNGAGRFSLPPSRVEAMYSPEVRAQVPNAPVVVGLR